MYSSKDLEKEIQEFILAGDRSARDITLRVCCKHGAASHEVGGYDSHSQLCQYMHTRKMVGRFLTDFTNKSEPAQQSFGGQDWKHIQAMYVCERAGDEIAVEPLKMTPDELREVAGRLSKSAQTMADHADELFRLADLLESERPGREDNN